MTNKFRNKICLLLSVAVALQCYFVQELIAAFVLFAIGFLVTALLILSVCLFFEACRRSLRLVGTTLR